MQPPHTFVAMAGGSPVAAYGIAEASRVVQGERSASRPVRIDRTHRAQRAQLAQRAPLATSRRVRLAMAARRLVTGTA